MSRPCHVPHSLNLQLHSLRLETNHRIVTLLTVWVTMARCTELCRDAHRTVHETAHVCRPTRRQHPTCVLTALTSQIPQRSQLCQPPQRLCFRNVHPCCALVLVSCKAVSGKRRPAGAQRATAACAPQASRGRAEVLSDPCSPPAVMSVGWRRHSRPRRGRHRRRHRRRRRRRRQRCRQRCPRHAASTRGAPSWRQGRARDRRGPPPAGSWARRASTGCGRA